MNHDSNVIQKAVGEVINVVNKSLSEYKPKLEPHEYGVITSVGEGIVTAEGLPGVQANELVRFPGNILGIAFNLDRKRIGIVMLDKTDEVYTGQIVSRTKRPVDIPVGDGLKGRTIDALGRPLDGKGAIHFEKRRPIESEAPSIMDRAPVKQPLQTGIKAIDALIPIGRGQRELIVGDRQTGKTAIALDTFINQKGENVICIYCAVGQKSSDIAKFISDLEEHDAIEYSIVVVADGEDPPGLKYITPYAAMSIAEDIMHQGGDALVVFDDLTTHARAYRELSLLMRRPPAREAYPGDIFYIHSRLLERSTHLKEDLGGGSVTALPVVETQAQNISAYIPTNLISITDGQVYLSPQMYQKGILPAIDVGKSVSRVGGKTQLPAYRGIAGDLRLAYSQFEELESFARFSTRLDEETRRKLERGRRVREILKQPQYEPLAVPEQIAVLMALNEGLFDDVELEKIGHIAKKIREMVSDKMKEAGDKILDGEELSDDDKDEMLDKIKSVIEKENK